jgi:hypothetical protein
MKMLMWAVNKITKDRFPILLRNDCERTYFDRETGEDESLVEVRARVGEQGFELMGIGEFDKWLKQENENAKR